MNATEIIRNIEAGQLKEVVPEFRVGDTARSKRETVREYRSLRES